MTFPVMHPACDGTGGTRYREFDLRIALRSKEVAQPGERVVERADKMRP